MEMPLGGLFPSLALALAAMALPSRSYFRFVGPLARPIPSPKSVPEKIALVNRRIYHETIKILRIYGKTAAGRAGLPVAAAEMAAQGAPVVPAAILGAPGFARAAWNAPARPR
jgi:hypothetical protein